MKKSSVRLVLVLVGLMSLVASWASAQNEFGPWQQSRCFSGIDERTRMTGEVVDGKHKWIVELRNRYQRGIAISVTAKESYVTSAKTTERFIIGPGRTEGTYYWLAETKTIMVFVDKLSMGDGPYLPCDAK